MLARLRALFRRAEVDRELEEEMEAHLAQDIARYRARGLAHGEAVLEARRGFGNLLAHAEAGREAWGWAWLEQLGQDLRYGARSLLRTPAFTLVAVLSLALGIGSNTAIAGLIYNVLLRPLAAAHPEELAVLTRVDRGERDQRFPYRAVEALSQAAGVKLTASRGGDNTPVELNGATAYLYLMFLDGDFFATVGIPAYRGRLIEPEDVRQAAPVAVVSAELARREFGSEDSVVGRSIRVRGQPFTVIGVTPPSFRGLQYPGYFQLAVPLTLETALGLPDSRRDSTAGFSVVARAGAPAGWPRTETAMDQALRQCCPTSSGSHLVLEEMTRGIGGGKDDMRGDIAPILYALMGCVAIVLLIACANVGNLLLLRAAAREREITLRLSLGSSRGRIVRQLLTESLLLGGAGILLGLLFAGWTRALLVRSLPDMGGDYLAIARFEPTLPVVLFAVLVGLAAVLACGLAPALRASRSDLSLALRRGDRAGSGRTVGGLGRGLVILQVALTLVLLTAGSLLVTTLRNLAAKDVGIGVAGVLGMAIETRGTRYESAGITPLYPEILQVARSIPGVSSAGVTTFAPLFGGRNSTVRVQRADGSAQQAEAVFIGISPGYFTTAEIALVSGRSFAESDRIGSEPVVIVGESIARQVGGDGAIGRMIRLPGWRDETYRVVGVVRDVNLYGPRDGATPAVYLPMGQLGTWPYVELLIRMTGDAPAPASLVTAAFERAIPGIRVRNIATGREKLAAWLLRELLAASLAGTFALLALGLAALGLYGVIAYNVARRTGEIGIRMALGASRPAVAGLVVRHAMTLVGAGFLVGIPVAILAGQGLGSILFGVSGHAILPVTLAVLVLGIVGLAAATIPAMRAVRVDPFRALRHD